MDFPVIPKVISSVVTAKSFVTIFSISIFIFSYQFLKELLSVPTHFMLRRPTGSKAMSKVARTCRKRAFYTGGVIQLTKRGFFNLVLNSGSIVLCHWRIVSASHLGKEYKNIPFHLNITKYNFFNHVAVKGRKQHHPCWIFHNSTKMAA